MRIAGKFKRVTSAEDGVGSRVDNDGANAEVGRASWRQAGKGECMEQVGLMVVMVD